MTVASTAVMSQASIEWVLGQNCHRLICLVQRVDPGHVVTLYFDGIPVKGCDCRTEKDLRAFVENEQTDWQSRGWQAVEVPSSFMRLISAPSDGVTLTPATVVSRD